MQIVYNKLRHNLFDCRNLTYFIDVWLTSVHHIQFLVYIKTFNPNG